MTKPTTEILRMIDNWADFAAVKNKVETYRLLTMAYKKGFTDGAGFIYDQIRREGKALTSRSIKQYRKGRKVQQ